MINRLPYTITVISIGLGVFIAILFGINERIFKDKIYSDLLVNPKVTSMYDGPDKTAYLAKEKSKNWRYYQRFHFHSTGIAALSLGILLLLGFFESPKKLKQLTQYFVAFGGFFYPFVWLFAAIYGPQIGRTAAKEKFAIFGYMGGLFLVGVLLTLFIVSKYPHRKNFELT